MKYVVLPFFVFLLAFQGMAQDSLAIKLYDSYELFKDDSLTHRRFKYSTVQSLIDELRGSQRFEVNQVGRSIEGLPLNMISMGQGNVDVFLWSQMHGDEPTATQAIFDIMNFFKSDTLPEIKDAILSNTRLHFLPMLNPDGAARYQRRNALGIDINRDALRLQSSEGQTLKRVRDSLNADFGFNLHDQSTHYNAELTEKPATLSYLAPAYNYEKEINTVRGNAMKVIVYMNRLVQKFAPGQVGRYNDAFEPRAFGDNIQKWGTSTILIESGGYLKDPEKQEIRKLNYVSLLAAMYAIATKAYENIDIAEYEKIPHNDRKLFDVKITETTYDLYGKPYTLDIGVNRIESNTMEFDDYFVSGRVVDVGDLSTYYGYETLDAKGMQLNGGNVYGQTFATVDDVKELDFLSLLRAGYTYVRVRQIPDDLRFSPYPMNLVSASYEVKNLRLQPGISSNFSLNQDGQAVYTILNGFVIDANTDLNSVKNGLIFR